MKREKTAENSEHRREIEKEWRINEDTVEVGSTKGWREKRSKEQIL